jgi:hypothetical protein
MDDKCFCLIDIIRAQRIRRADLNKRAVTYFGIKVFFEIKFKLAAHLCSQFDEICKEFL